MSVQRYTTSQCVWSESRRWLLPFHFILIFCRAELLWLQSTLRFGVIIGVTSLALYSRGMSCKLQNLSKQTCFHETLCWWGKLLWVSDISQSLRKLSKWKRYFCMLIFMNCLALDTLAEWLRRRPAKPMGSPRAGSNPAGVAFPFVNLAPAPNTFPIDWSFPTLEPRHCQLKALLPDINWSLYAGLLFARALLVEGLSWMSVFVRNGCCSPLNQQSCKKHNGKTAGSSFHFIFFSSFLVSFNTKLTRYNSLPPYLSSRFFYMAQHGTLSGGASNSHHVWSSGLHHFISFCCFHGFSRLPRNCGGPFGAYLSEKATVCEIWWGLMASIGSGGRPISSQIFHTARLLSLCIGHDFPPLLTSGVSWRTKLGNSWSYEAGNVP